MWYVQVLQWDRWPSMNCHWLDHKCNPIPFVRKESYPWRSWVRKTCLFQLIYTILDWCGMTSLDVNVWSGHVWIDTIQLFGAIWNAFFSETCGKHPHPTPRVAWGSFWAFSLALVLSISSVLSVLWVFSFFKSLTSATVPRPIHLKILRIYTHSNCSGQLSLTAGLIMFFLSRMLSWFISLTQSARRQNRSYPI